MRKSTFLIVFLLPIIIVFIFCEFIVYYAVISKCSWPELPNPDAPKLKCLLLADTHLLGPLTGHWFDKLRREWQMHRAFQTAVSLLSPNAVFILGDVFDEGEWLGAPGFAAYLVRFWQLFHVPDEISLYVVPGNHDVGFHDNSDWYKINRFNKRFNLSSVQLVSLPPVQFILINSMAFHGDNCELCQDAEERLKMIARKFDCNREKRCHGDRPILLQHFPLYRTSDAACSQVDEAPAEIKNVTFREKWDCLSKKATEKMLYLLHPRCVFTGHTHHGCHLVHEGGYGEKYAGVTHEYSIPSFSWRNKNNPTFTLAVFTNDDYKVEICEMPKESTVILIYTVTGILALAFLIVTFIILPCVKASARLQALLKWKQT